MNEANENKTTEQEKAPVEEITEQQAEGTEQSSAPQPQAKPAPKPTQKKKSDAKRFKDDYFSYYDDVKDPTHKIYDW